jgi:hypothetical protein
MARAEQQLIGTWKKEFFQDLENSQALRIIG